MADSNYDNQERDFRRRWYQAHVRRFQEELKDGPRQEVAQQGPSSRGSAARFLEFITGETVSEASEEYQGLLEQLGADSKAFETVAVWWDKEKPVFVDPVLVDRFKFRLSFWDDSSREWDSESLPARMTNARAIHSVAKHVGSALHEEVASLLGRELKSRIVNPWPNGQPRWDLQVEWGVLEQYGGSLRVWINYQGMTICLSPGIGPPDRYGGKGTEKRWYGEIIETSPDWKQSGFEVINVSGGRYGQDHGFSGRIGSFVYGKWYEKEQLEGMDLREEFNSVVPQLRPVLDKWMDLYHPSKDPCEPPPPPPCPIAALVKELLVDKESLEQIIGLLEDKGQVILYGPPGTGKTFLAKKLAECLAPDDSQRAFVQFHPSMSYEDFFEGYRPYTGDDGAMSYRLTSGPLRNIARQAASDSDKRHVMIIDEINRANLPKVLGELLFLLEYRDDTVLPLYRPSEPFGLPPNLWFIGTMNTADRSIALVDAALRRRFHFVPFFPHQGPMKGLLERWLAANNEQRWVGELVAGVNRRLSEALGGPHLQLGHSHFMKRGISDLGTGQMKRVWRYTVEPFIEEQFFDDPDQVRSFRWEEVIKPYTSKSDPEQPAAPEPPTDEDQDSSTD